MACPAFDWNHPDDVAPSRRYDRTAKEEVSMKHFLILSLVLASAGPVAAEPGQTWAGYVAQVACGAVHVEHRSLAQVLAQDLADTAPGIQVTSTMQPPGITATAGDGVYRAIYGGSRRGCTLYPPGTRAPARVTQVDAGLRPNQAAPWPLGERVTLTPMPALEQALDHGFSEPDPTRPRVTRAVVVVHHGQIVAERYAPGFTAATPQLGWSMNKSITGALTGIAVERGLLRVDDTASIGDWPEAARPTITIADLLHMSSGLVWDETYHPGSDVARALFGAEDAVRVVTERPPGPKPPGTVFNYSTGDTLALAAVLKGVVGDVADFAQTALFDRIGMHTAVIERDASGNLLSGAMGYATPRDWARFGLLFLNQGLWYGEQVVPASWVDYSRTPAPASMTREYGAQFWLIPNLPGLPLELPRDTFMAVGHMGQSVVIVPSRDLVIVRMGWAPNGLDGDPMPLILEVLAALPT
jgi:CubicO group peptidase (beta-lactamase class C family)